jgi:hypothetical protein
MSGCILHYGMPKTGSSSIQTWLLRGLEDPRWHYLNLGRRGSGNLLVSAFDPDSAAHPRNRKRGIDDATLARELEEYRASLDTQLAALGTRRAIFSAERLAGVGEPVLRAICEQLAPACGEIRAVGYVRAPTSFMESIYQQRLKAGNHALRPRQIYPGYRARLGKFEQVLGREQVEFWRFDPPAFPRGCVVRDFCTRLDIHISPEDLPRVNDSLSLEALRLLYVYRRFGPGYGRGEQAMRENTALKEHLMGLRGPKLRLHAALTAPVLRAEHEDIRWMEERLGCSLAEAPCEDAGAVKAEEDLMRCSAVSLDWLGASLERAPLPVDAGPERVAEEIHRLRLKIAAGRTGAPAPAAPPGQGSLLARLWRRRGT